MSDISTNDDGQVVVGDNAYDPGVAQAGLALIDNSRADTPNRTDLMRRMGQQYDGERDIHEVLGYPDKIEPEDYRSKYERLDVATRIVEMPADDTWRESPNVIDDDTEDTSFEDDIRKLDQNVRLYHYLRRLDVVCGIGEYGLMLVGLEDGQSLDEPPSEGNISDVEDVAYLTPFAQDHVEDWELGKHVDDSEHTNPGDSRYNRPVKYQIDFNAFLDDEDIPDTGEQEDLQWVHWRRIIHVAEGKTENDLRGTPRQKPVYNRLIDYEKVIGASAEMFWTGAAPRFHFDIDTDNPDAIPTQELEDLDGEVKDFVHDMQTYLKTFNTDVEVIGGEEVDPTGVLDNLYAAFSGQTGIPQRILKGSERGELASSQDRSNWFDRIRTRQHRFAEPEILRKVIRRLIDLGALDEPTDGTYTVEWPNLFELNDIEESEVMMNRSNVAQSIAPQGNTHLLPGTMGEWVKFVREGELPDDIYEMDSDPPEDPDSVNVSYSLNAEFERGQKVMFDGLEATIQDIKESNFENHQEEEIEASEDDPQYILVTIEGLAYARENDIDDESWGTDVDTPEDDLANNSIVGNIYDNVSDPRTDPLFDNVRVLGLSYNAVTVSDVPGLDDPGIGFDDWPDSWEESDTPARVIALDAWTSMGAQFDCGGGCCKGTMLQGGMSERGANKFCAAFKDEMLMTTHWRGRF